MSFTEQCNKIFNQAIRDYHMKDDVDTPINNPYDRDSIDNRLYLKCWIDTVQWHLEDIIRDPHIDPIEALQLKRRIDRSNQDRTKIYHMREQAERNDASQEHIQKCKAKLNILLEQQTDLSTAIDQLLEDIETGRKYMKVYRQMKMYNDPATNPVLYKNK